MDPEIDPAVAAAIRRLCSEIAEHRERKKERYLRPCKPADLPLTYEKGAFPTAIAAIDRIAYDPVAYGLAATARAIGEILSIWLSCVKMGAFLAKELSAWPYDHQHFIERVFNEAWRGIGAKPSFKGYDPARHYPRFADQPAP